MILHFDMTGPAEGSVGGCLQVSHELHDYPVQLPLQAHHDYNTVQLPAAQMNDCHDCK